MDEIVKGADSSFFYVQANPVCRLHLGRITAFARLHDFTLHVAIGLD